MKSCVTRSCHGSPRLITTRSLGDELLRRGREGERGQRIEAQSNPRISSFDRTTQPATLRTPLRRGVLRDFRRGQRYTEPDHG